MKEKNRLNKRIPIRFILPRIIFQVPGLIQLRFSSYDIVDILDLKLAWICSHSLHDGQ